MNSEPTPGGADHVDVFPVGLDDLLYDGEAQPRALFVLSSGKVGFVETVPDLFQGILGIPTPVSLTETKTFSYRGAVWI